MGADVTLYHEAKELKERGVLTTSCCPSFVMFIEKNFPDLVKYVSSSVSPMVETAFIIKREDPLAKCVFIGPCTSKKLEYRLPKTKGGIDSVLSFEELQAFFDARELDLAAMEDCPVDDASYYGRIFAKSGGITQGVVNVAKSMGVDNVKPVSMSGLEECKINLLKLRLGRAAENFFEGMACEGGCLNGALSLHHEQRSVVDIDKYSNAASNKDIGCSVKRYEHSLEAGKANGSEL